MKKILLTSLVLGATLLMSTGCDSQKDGVEAEKTPASKCGAGKCGDAKKAPASKCGAGKCGDEK